MEDFRLILLTEIFFSALVSLGIVLFVKSTRKLKKIEAEKKKRNEAF